MCVVPVEKALVPDTFVLAGAPGQPTFPGPALDRTTARAGNQMRSERIQVKNNPAKKQKLYLTQITFPDPSSCVII